MINSAFASPGIIKGRRGISLHAGLGCVAKVGFLLIKCNRKRRFCLRKLILMLLK